jgi:hypothetical protein
VSPSAYETTRVPVERSQAELRRLLARYNCQRLGFTEERDDDGQRWASVTFQIANNAIRMRVPLKLVSEHAVGSAFTRARTSTRDDIRDRLYEQEERRVWRVLAWNLKARLVAVDERLETFEEAFLAHIVDPRTNRTIYQQLAQDGRVELPAPLLALTEGNT